MDGCSDPHRNSYYRDLYGKEISKGKSSPSYGRGMFNATDHHGHQGTVTEAPGNGIIHSMTSLPKNWEEARAKDDLMRLRWHCNSKPYKTMDVSSDPPRNNYYHGLYESENNKGKSSPSYGRGMFNATDYHGNQGTPAEGLGNRIIHGIMSLPKTLEDARAKDNLMRLMAQGEREANYYSSMFEQEERKGEKKGENLAEFSALANDWAHQHAQDHYQGGSSSSRDPALDPTDDDVNTLTKSLVESLFYLKNQMSERSTADRTIDGPDSSLGRKGGKIDHSSQVYSQNHSEVLSEMRRDDNHGSDHRIYNDVDYRDGCRQHDYRYHDTRYAAGADGRNDYRDVYGRSDHRDVRHDRSAPRSDNYPYHVPWTNQGMHNYQQQNYDQSYDDRNDQGYNPVVNRGNPGLNYGLNPTSHHADSHHKDYRSKRYHADYISPDRYDDNWDRDRNFHGSNRGGDKRCEDNRYRGEGIATSQGLGTPEHLRGPLNGTTSNGGTSQNGPREYDTIMQGPAVMQGPFHGAPGLQHTSSPQRDGYDNNNQYACPPSQEEPRNKLNKQELRRRGKSKQRQPGKSDFGNFENGWKGDNRGDTISLSTHAETVTLSDTSSHHPHIGIPDTSTYGGGTLSRVDEYGRVDNGHPQYPDNHHRYRQCSPKGASVLAQKFANNFPQVKSGNDNRFVSKGGRYEQPVDQYRTDELASRGSVMSSYDYDEASYEFYTSVIGPYNAQSYSPQIGAQAYRNSKSSNCPITGNGDSTSSTYSGNYNNGNYSGKYNNSGNYSGDYNNSGDSRSAAANNEFHRRHELPFRAHLPPHPIHYDNDFCADRMVHCRGIPVRYTLCQLLNALFINDLIQADPYLSVLLDPSQPSLINTYQLNDRELVDDGGRLVIRTKVAYDYKAPTETVTVPFRSHTLNQYLSRTGSGGMTATPTVGIRGGGRGFDSMQEVLQAHKGPVTSMTYVSLQGTHFLEMTPENTADLAVYDGFRKEHQSAMRMFSWTPPPQDDRDRSNGDRNGGGNGGFYTGVSANLSHQTLTGPWMKPGRFDVVARKFMTQIDPRVLQFIDFVSLPRHFENNANMGSIFLRFRHPLVAKRWQFLMEGSKFPGASHKELYFGIIGNSNANKSSDKPGVPISNPVGVAEVVVGAASSTGGAEHEEIVTRGVDSICSPDGNPDDRESVDDGRRGESGNRQSRKSDQSNGKSAGRKEKTGKEYSFPDFERFLNDEFGFWQGIFGLDVDEKQFPPSYLIWGMTNRARNRWYFDHELIENVENTSKRTRKQM